MDRPEAFLAHQLGANNEVLSAPLGISDKARAKEWSMNELGKIGS